MSESIERVSQSIERVSQSIEGVLESIEGVSQLMERDLFTTIGTIGLNSKEEFDNVCGARLGVALRIEGN